MVSAHSTLVPSLGYDQQREETTAINESTLQRRSSSVEV
jgi:hypothetical protein